MNILSNKWSSSIFGQISTLGMVVFSDYKQEFYMGHLCILVWLLPIAVLLLGGAHI